MSRMTKYLKQKCTYEKPKYSKDGEILFDKFGGYQYEEAAVIKCRREETVQEVQTSTGAILKSTARYFTDAAHPVQVNYKLDGMTVIKAHEYINQFGRPEGYVSYV